jgi:c-di-GMP-binding flagellar brake protein YcgR
MPRATQTLVSFLSFTRGLPRDLRLHNEGYIVQEQRRHQRAALHATVEISRASGAKISGTAADISLGGMFVEIEEVLPFSEEVRIRFASPIDARVMLDVPGKVRWTRTNGAGIQFGLIGAAETHAIVEYLRTAIGQ